MRCPNCQHIVFGDVTVCAGCGHDLSLLQHRQALSVLELKTDPEPIGKLPDFPLHHPAASVIPKQAHSDEKMPKSSAVHSAMPLFPFSRKVSDVEATARPAASRPLSVRRKTSEISKPRSHTLQTSPVREALTFDLADTPTAAQTAVSVPVLETFRILALRIKAGLVDVALLLSIDAVVVYLTLRFTGLPVFLIGRLLFFPLAAFLLVLNIGYVVALTAVGGQTIGKMAFGLRVQKDDGSPVTVVTALGRTAAYVVSLLPAGLGFTGLFFGKRLALHDLLADTRVTKLP